MKKYIFFIFLFFYLPVKGQTAQNNPPLDNGFSIANTFSLLDTNTHKNFIKGIVFYKQNSDFVKPLKKGKIIYTFRENEGLLPESFGHKDLVAIQNNQLKEYYSSFTLKKDLSEEKSVDTNSLLGKTSRIPNTYRQGFLFYTHMGDKFIQPLSFFKIPLDEENPLTLYGLLFTSGIYQKIISKNNKNIYLPLRKNFKIFFRASKKIPYFYRESNPKSLSLTITDTTTNKVILQKNCSYYFIKGNTIGNSYLKPTEFYKRHWLTYYTYLGLWEKRNRTDTYNISVTVTTYDNQTDSFNLNASFR